MKNKKALINQLLTHQDQQVLLKLISELTPANDEALTQALLHLLEHTPFASVRNKIAIHFRDHQNLEAYEVIVKLLSAEKTLRNRGTLLYALEVYDNLSNFELLIDLAIYGNYEVNAEACYLLSRLDGEIEEKAWSKARTKISSAIPLATGQKKINLERVRDFFIEESI